MAAPTADQVKKGTEVMSYDEKAINRDDGRPINDDEKKVVDDDLDDGKPAAEEPEPASAVGYPESHFLPEDPQPDDDDPEDFVWIDVGAKLDSIGERRTTLSPWAAGLDSRDGRNCFPCRGLTC